MDELLGQAKKIPVWGWIAAAVVAGGIVLYTNYRSSQNPAAPTVDTTGIGQPPNTTTDTGNAPCATYQTPNCNPPDFVIFEADQFGCPMPVCASSLLPGPAPTPPPPGGGGSGVTCHVVQHGEFLSEIAGAAGTPGGWPQLVTWNKVPNACGPGYPALALNPNLIYAGWDLRVN